MDLATLFDQKHRAYYYRVLIALGPVLVLYGVVSVESWPIWLALISQVLGVTMAAANTSTKDQ